MPNLEKQFKDLLDKISLSTTQEKTLRTSRDSDRGFITKHFAEELNKKKRRRFTCKVLSLMRWGQP